MKSYQLLKSVLDAAIEMRYISVNPMPTLKLRKEQRKLHPYLTHDEVRELVDEMPIEYRDLIALLAYTGLRFGEAAALEPRSIDLVRQRLHVIRSVSEVKGKLTYGPPKNGKKRTVPLPKTLITMLERGFRPSRPTASSSQRVVEAPSDSRRGAGGSFKPRSESSISAANRRADPRSRTSLRTIFATPPLRSPCSQERTSRSSSACSDIRAQRSRSTSTRISGTATLTTLRRGSTH